MNARNRQIGITHFVSLVLALSFIVLAWSSGLQGARRVVAESQIALRLAPPGFAISGAYEDQFGYPLLLPTRHPSTSAVSSLLVMLGVWIAWSLCVAGIGYCAAVVDLSPFGSSRVKNMLRGRSRTRIGILAPFLSSICMSLFFWLWLVVSLIQEDRRGPSGYASNTPVPSITINDHPTCIVAMMLGWFVITAVILRHVERKSVRSDLSKFKTICSACGYSLPPTPAAADRVRKRGMCPECGPVSPLNAARHRLLQRSLTAAITSRYVRWPFAILVFIMATAPVSLMMCANILIEFQVPHSSIHEWFRCSDRSILRALGRLPN